MFRRFKGAPQLLPVPAGFHRRPRANILIFGVLLCLLVAAGLLIGQLLSAVGDADLLPHSKPGSHAAIAASQLHPRADEGPPSLWAGLRTLVCVAGHAIWLGGPPARAESWVLQDFQVGQQQAFVEHIGLGVFLAARIPDSLLLFSGGASRASAGPRTEALGYWQLAESAGWFGQAASEPGSPGGDTSSVRFRSGTEDFARDSFENLLFSVARFRELVGRLPERIVVVGFGFKAYRFAELHRPALGFPAEHFYYAGLDPEPPGGLSEPSPGAYASAGGSTMPLGNSDGHFSAGVRRAGDELLRLIRSGQPQTRFSPPDPERAELASWPALRRALAGELANSGLPFRADPYGCHPPLSDKRLDRNPFRRHHGYELGAPELQGLLRWCGPEPFPWGSGTFGQPLSPPAAGSFS